MQYNSIVTSMLKQELKVLEDTQKFLKVNRNMYPLTVACGVSIKVRSNKTYNKAIMLNSMKITYLYFLLDNNSPAGNHGKVSRNSNHISNVDNSEIRKWLRKIHNTTNISMPVIGITNTTTNRK